MSLSLPLKDPNGRQYSRDSFDRFGDDLSELLLSYLCFEDKFRFECVSKQFQRLVFNKVIHIDDMIFSGKESYRERMELLICSHLLIPSSMTSDQMLTVIKKCPNVKTIQLYVNSATVSSLPLLSDNCHRLTSIKLFIEEEVSSEVINEFGQKFGLKVEEIYSNIWDDSVIRQLFNWCPNLKRLYCKGFHWLILVGNQLVPTLNSLGPVYVESEQMSEFIRLVDKYENTMKNIDLSFHDFVDIDPLFQQIYRFKNLECLHLYITSTVSHLDLTSRMTALSQYCPKLSKITFDIQKFQLSRPKKPLIGIKSLSINCNEKSDNTELRDDFFAIISNLTPNVKEFKFTSNLNYTNKHLTDLSRMKSLKRLELESRPQKIHPIDDSAVIQLLDNCQQLKELKLDFKSNITVKTIDKLKEVANNRHKETIRFTTYYSDNKPESIDKILTDIPNNLFIAFENMLF